MNPTPHEGQIRYHTKNEGMEALLNTFPVLQVRPGPQEPTETEHPTLK